MFDSCTLYQNRNYKVYLDKHTSMLQHTNAYPQFADWNKTSPEGEDGKWLNPGKLEYLV